MPSFMFTLYITGDSAESHRLIALLHEICGKYLDTNYALTVINVLEAPQQALAENILATPTLIREMPPPHRRFMGDLRRIDHIINALGLDGCLADS